MTIISRSLSLPEITGRTLEGTAYQYAHPSDVTDNGVDRYFEQILEGADTKTIRDRAAQGGTFDLLVWHSQTSNRGHFPAEPIGAVEFRPTATGLDYRAVVKRSPLGDEMLELVRDETARDVSVSYKPLRDIEGVLDGRLLVSRAEIALRELSLVPTGCGQYEGAKVLVMRATDAPATRLDVSARLRLLNL